MITPIRALSIHDICKRENDLLVSKDDIKKLAKNERNKAIDDFFNELQKYEEADDWLRLKMTSIYEIAQQLKEGVNNESDC